MVFEIIEKSLRGFHIGDEMISIAKTTVSFGKVITKEFLEKGFVEVYLDRDNNLVGFKLSKDIIKGFKILKKENDFSVRIVSKIICESIPTGIYDAKKEGDMWVIKVPEIAKK